MIFKALNKALIRTKQSMRLMVGVPDYEMYVNHMKTAHPEQSCHVLPGVFSRTPRSSLWRKRPIKSLL